MVALLMVPLIGFAAISIDVAAMWAERQQLQTGADAGALALAQDCARGSCADAAGTAQAMAAANLDDGNATSSVSSIGADEVSVTTSGVREHFFAPVLGISSNTIVARSTASWGFPTGGTAQLPLTISWCDFRAQTGGGPPTSNAVVTIPMTEQPEPAVLPADSDPAALPTEPEAGALPEEAATCSGPRGEVPSGFGWLTTDSGCETSSSIATGAAASGGGSVSAGCSSAGFSELQGRTVLLPIFNSYAGTDGAGRYGVFGYAAFTLTGYHFAGRFSWGSPCSGSDSCISGSFTRFADLSDDFDHDEGAPQLGAAVVSLTR
jgi:Flp pilus assembly protein TadG